MTTELSLFADDPFNRVMARIRLGRDRPAWALQRAVLAWAITWLMMALLAAVSGVAVGPSLRETFLADFAAYGQYWIALPLMLLAEPTVERRLTLAFPLLARSGLVRPEDVPSLAKAVAAANRSQSWWFVDLVLLAVTYAMGAMWLVDELGNGSGSWHARLGPGGESITLPGMWLLLIGIPALNFVLLRWVWKIVVWYHLLWKVSRLRLRINVLHPDMAGGLGFLGDLQTVFGMLIFAIGSLVATTVGYKVTVEGSQLLTVPTAGPAVAFVCLAPPTFLAPLLFFSSQMYWAKARGLARCSVAATAYLSSLEDKWLGVNGDADGPSVGPGEVQSLSDSGAVFDRVRQMRILPFDLGTVSRLLMSAGAPMIPLFAKFFPALQPLLDFFG